MTTETKRHKNWYDRSKAKVKATHCHYCSKPLDPSDIKVGVDNHRICWSRAMLAARVEPSRCPKRVGGEL